MNLGVKLQFYFEMTMEIILKNHLEVLILHF